MFGHRLFGHYYWFGGWIMMLVNGLLPQLFWFKKVRQNLVLIFIIAVLINIGMWFERFVIIVGSLYQDFLPANWGIRSTRPGWMPAPTSARSACFSCMYLLFVRFLPMIAISEVKGVTPHADPHHPLGGAKGAKP